MPQVLDGATLRRWCDSALAALTEAREEIDALNVFPVADGDTGTNLVLTMAAAAEAVAEMPGSHDDLGATARAMAHGAMMGARGNSGVILSQLLRGFAEAWSTRSVSGGRELQQALGRAADLGYAAVAAPVEGTVLSVARGAADAAGHADPDDLAAVARAAEKGAAEALAHTPTQLPELAAAVVVDAGGRGLCLLLDALHAVIAGEVLDPTPRVRAGDLLVRRDRVEGVREAGSASLGYEVQYLLDADEHAVARLRERLGELGDSLVVVGGAGSWNVHVHVNDVGAAVEAGVQAGRPHRISVTRFAGRADEPAGAGAAEPAAGRAVVAVAPGPRLRALFAREGARVLPGGRTANPSASELLDAIVGSGAVEVVLLPNDASVAATAAVAAEEARRAGVAVAVVPTRSPVQGLAALAVARSDRRFTDELVAMTAAAAATRCAEVTAAVRAARTTVGECRRGDVLGRIEGETVAIGADVETVARAVLDRLLLAGGELVTLILGLEASAELPSRLVEHLAVAHPAVETVVYDGRQPHYPLLIGVE